MTYRLANGADDRNVRDVVHDGGYHEDGQPTGPQEQID